MHISKPISRERSTYRKEENRSSRHRRKKGFPWGTDWQRGFRFFRFLCRIKQLLKAAGTSGRRSSGRPTPAAVLGMVQKRLTNIALIKPKYYKKTIPILAPKNKITPKEIKCDFIVDFSHFIFYNNLGLADKLILYRKEKQLYGKTTDY